MYRSFVMTRSPGNHILRAIRAIETCYQQRRNFSGRAARSEFWWAFTVSIFLLLAGLALSFFIPLLILIWIIDLIETLPGVSAVTVRRLHDVNRKGWWALIPVGSCLGGAIAGYVWAGSFLEGLFFALYGGMILGILGFLPLLKFLAQPTCPHENKYGPNPLLPQQDTGSNGHAGSGRTD